MVPAVAAAGIGALGDIGGGLVDAYFNDKAADKSWKRNKKVLQNQVQWRVADAVKAGLHPLAALGMSPASGPSTMIGSSLGGSLSAAGQNIGRAAEALLTPTDKIAAKSALLALEQQQANIDLTRAQLAGAQKALLTQGSTPGIASRITPETNLTTKVPNRAQIWEDYAGDFVGGAVGGLGALSDWWRGEMARNPPPKFDFSNDGDFSRSFDQEPWY